MNRLSDDVVYQVLGVDPLSVAEKITGKSIHKDDTTVWLGAHIAYQNQQARSEVLSALGDVHHNSSLKDYLSVIKEEGFEEVLSLPIENVQHEGDSFFVFFKESEGLLLAFDTYWGGKSVNSGNVYYNWIPNEVEKCYRYTSSGGFGKEGVCGGYHDCREGLRFHIRQLREHGRFVTPWNTGVLLWLCHYGDRPRYEGHFQLGDTTIDDIRNERIAMLPKHVQEAIQGGLQD